MAAAATTANAASGPDPPRRRNDRRRPMLAPGDARDNTDGVARGANAAKLGKVGEGPAEVDEEGRPVVNPYIPQFISKAPWYVGQGASDEALSHQRQEENAALQYGLSGSAGAGARWYDRGGRAGPAGTKYRKGACENCGAMTHKRADCLERPRKRGAKWSGADIQADEVLTKLDLSWDGKRDLANGYDFADHGLRLQERHDAKLAASAGEVVKKTDVEGARLTTQQKTGTDVGPQSIAEMMASQSQHAPMRLRDDTATYLRPGQDHGDYNPKSRSMRPGEAASADADLADKAGDGFTRGHKTDAAFSKDQVFAWEAKPVAPAAASVDDKRSGDANGAEVVQRRRELQSKYGIDDGATKSLPERLLDGDIEAEEADQSARAPKFEEDVLTNGHTTVYGSFYDIATKHWGYKCCKTLGKNAYCTRANR